MARPDPNGRLQSALGVSSDERPTRNIHLAEVLSGLSAAEAEAITRMAKDQTWAPGACIFSYGERQQGVYLVKKGLLEEFRLTENGDKLPINRAGPGTLLGLSSTEGNFCCFAEAVEDSVVGFLSFQTLQEICRRFPSVAVNMIGVLARRLGDVETRLEVLAFSGLRVRVVWALLELYAVHGPRLKGVTHESLGAWASSSRPKVSMILEELQQKRLLRLSRGEIEVRDPSGLKEWAKQVAGT